MRKLVFASAVAVATVIGGVGLPGASAARLASPAVATAAMPGAKVQPVFWVCRRWWNGHIWVRHCWWRRPFYHPYWGPGPFWWHPHPWWW
jgi:hypothetical protein